jgi:hypothetical protein
MRNIFLILMVALGITVQAQRPLIGIFANSMQPSAATKWDISAGIARGIEFDMNESNIQDIWMKDDGSTWWAAGATGDDIFEYTTLVPYRIEGSTLTATLDISSYDTTIVSIYWHPSGDFLIMSGLQGDDLTRLNFSTPWDISTVSSSSVSGVISGGLYDVRWEPDGLHFWGCRLSTNYELRRYELSSAWDVTTINTTYVALDDWGSFKPSNFGFNADGKQMWAGDENSGLLNTYDLATAYDPTTKVLTGSEQTVYTGSMRAGYMLPGKTDIFYLGGAGTNIEVKEYTFMSGIQLDTEYVANGGFDSDTVWSKQTGWTISGGTASFDGTATGYIRQDLAEITPIGEYIVSVDVVANTGSSPNSFFVEALRFQDDWLPVQTWKYRVRGDAIDDVFQYQIYGRIGEAFEIDNATIRRVVPIGYTPTSSLYSIANAAAPGNQEAQNVDSWTYTPNNTISVSNDAYDGDYSISIKNTGGAFSTRREYDFTGVDGQDYEIKIWAKKISGANVRFAAWTGFTSSPSTSISSTSWTEYTFNLTASGTAQKIRVYPSSDSGTAAIGDEVLIDNITIIATP